MTHLLPFALTAALALTSAQGCSARSASSASSGASSQPAEASVTSTAPGTASTTASTSTSEKPVHETRPDTQVPGYEVVIVDAMDGGPARGELRKADQVQVGAPAFKTAVGVVGTDDADQLALLAAAFVDPAGASLSPWKPGDPVLGSSTPAAPAVQGSTLTYYRAHRQRPEMVRVVVDVQRGSATASTVTDEALVTASDTGPVSAARTAAAGSDVSAIRSALEQAAMVKDPAAGAFFSEFLANDSRAFLRKAAVDVVARHKPPGGQQALATALSGDADKDVRRAAARALESWGSPTEARAALEQAASNDADPVVRAIAGRVVAAMN